MSDHNDSPTGLGRNFWAIFTSFTASNLGDGLTLVAFPLLAISLTGDARLVALVAAARTVPFLLIGLPAGVVIDRLDRRKLAMVAQIGRAIALLLVGWAVIGDRASITYLAVGAFAVGVGEVLIDGGLPAVVRDIVASSQLEVANSRLRASETVSNMFIGPPIGAFLAEIHVALPLLAAAGLYVFGTGLLTRVRGSFVPEIDAEPGSFVHQMTRGLHYVWNHAVLRPLAFAVALFSFFGNATDAIFVLLATERLGLSKVQYGLLLSADAVAAVVMSFFVLGLVKRTSHGTSMRLSVVTFAGGAILLGSTLAIPLVVLAIVLGGVSDPTWNVISATVRQRLVDDNIFGRMMTAYLFIAWSFQPLGSMFGGEVAERFGPEWVFVCAGVGVGSLAITARPLFRRVNEAMASA